MRNFRVRNWSMALLLLLVACPSLYAQHEVPLADGVALRAKQRDGKTDKVFASARGRELSFRGFNVSGKVKHAEFGFKAFKDATDARESLSLLRRKTGANIIRYTLAWEGVQPQAGLVDRNYLKAISEQIAVAADMGLYVLLDYHSDLYSRHTFTANSGNTGNGAPKWAVSDIYGKDSCGLPCELTWSAHKLSDSAVRNAVRGFWYDHWALNRTFENVNLYAKGVQRCVGIAGKTPKNSAGLVADSCVQTNEQTWQLSPDGTIRAATDKNFCLDVDGANSALGTKIQVYRCNNSKAQQFVPDRFERIHTMLDVNKCLTIKDGKLQVAACSFPGKAAYALQQFQLNDSHTLTPLPDSMAFVQSEFVWQLGETLDYLGKHLTKQQRAMIVGVDPINEPFDGGIGALTYSDWDNEILWPFYERIRSEMDARSWNSTPIFAEPLVFWSSLAGIVAPATGGGYLKYQPGDGFVFNSHFYDQGRMGVNDLSVAQSKAYFKNIDLIRDEARYLNLTPFLSEFGMWLDGYGHTDTERIVNATYQAMESSNRTNKGAFIDFYTPLVSGTQWQWDYYYDKHNEVQNANPAKLVTDKDAWNRENFSVVRDYGENYNVNQELIQRAYPRAVQGELLHFAYEGRVPDRAGKILNYFSLRASLPPLIADRDFIKDTEFAFMAWQGRLSEDPTEIYWPRHLQSNDFWLITDGGIFYGADLSKKPQQSANEAAKLADFGEDSGQRILIWDDVDASEDSKSIHFALIVNGGAKLSAKDRLELQAAIQHQLKQGRSPVYIR